MANATKPTDIDGYIAPFAADVQSVLQEVRETRARMLASPRTTISQPNNIRPAMKQKQLGSLTRPVTDAENTARA
jgi:hypothetical protein